VRPDVDVDTLPDEFRDNPDKTRALYESLIFATTAVAPTAPPKNFVPIEFLNYLISLLHQSRQLGWIQSDGVHQSLLAKLINAKRKLEVDRPEARNLLNAFLNEVQATSCQDFTCTESKPLTSEAYALLYFNGQFLLQRLP
jgi:hypothetical protein